MAEQKIKRYVSDNAQLMAEWDWAKNTLYLPNNLSVNSGKKVWWVCSKGHSYESRIADRSNGHGCPFCSGRKAVPGLNDFATVYPLLAEEWDFDNNKSLLPSQFKPSSNRNVWWNCRRGHSWRTSIKNRTNGHGCPYCAKVKAIPGENDFKTQYPHIAEEWHPSKNENSSAVGVACFSNKKVWWLGMCGHEWQDSPGHRVMGRGCPICKKQNKTSFPEQAIYYYISKQYSDAVNSFSDIFSDAMELDIYIPSLKIGIEYDGKAWHNSKSSLVREKKKFRICRDNDIYLIRIKEKMQDTDTITCDGIIYCSDNLDSTILELSRYFHFDIDVNVARDRLYIQKSYLISNRQRSFLDTYPNISKEWHPTKNGSLSPAMFSPGSGEIVWWLCKSGHEWKMAFKERAKGNGCPYCSNHRVLIGFNDLQTLNSELAYEWHPSSNHSKTPSNVLATSTDRVWWQCKNGHEWQAQIRERYHGTGCPYCSNKKVLVGYNDLATTNKKLVLEWDFAKNGDLTPTMLTSGSSKKVWWRCSICGYSWQSTVSNRNRGSGCPKCRSNINFAPPK